MFTDRQSEAFHPALQWDCLRLGALGPVYGDEKARPDSPDPSHHSVREQDSQASPRPQTWAQGQEFSRDIWEVTTRPKGFVGSVSTFPYPPFSSKWPCLGLTAIP